MKSGSTISRRHLLKTAEAFAVLAGLERLAPAYADTSADGEQPLKLIGNTIDLTIAETPFRVDDKAGMAVTINGTVPGPLVRLREGEEVTLRVTNRLKEVSSIHWHGLLLPPEMDGVPGVSFAGIKPESTFTYRFPLKQSGTYWFHSHSGTQEQDGVYAPMIIEPAAPDLVKYDRDYVVVLSNWSFASGMTMISDLKKQSGFFNYQRRTMLEFVSDVRRNGWKPTMDNYLLWSRMRMDPTDFADVTSQAFVHLINGLSPTGMSAEVPARRPRPLRTMDDMGMNMSGIDNSGKNKKATADGKNISGVDPGLKSSDIKTPSGHENMPGMQAPAPQKQQGAQEMPGMKMDAVGDQSRVNIPGSTPCGAQ